MISGQFFKLMMRSMESEAFSLLLLVVLVVLIPTFASSHFLVRLNRAIFLLVDASTDGAPAGEGLLDDKSPSTSSEQESEFSTI